MAVTGKAWSDKGLKVNLTHRLLSVRTSTKGANWKFHGLQAQASATNETFCWLLWALFFCYFSLEKQRKVMKYKKISSFLLSWNKRNKNSRLLKILLKSSWYQADSLKALREQPKESTHLPSLLIPLDFYTTF